MDMLPRRSPTGCLPGVKTPVPNIDWAAEKNKKNRKKQSPELAQHPERSRGTEPVHPRRSAARDTYDEGQARRHAAVLPHLEKIKTYRKQLPVQGAGAPPTRKQAPHVGQRA